MLPIPDEILKPFDAIMEKNPSRCGSGRLTENGFGKSGERRIEGIPHPPLDSGSGPHILA